MIRKYSELKKLKTFEERFEYLNLQGLVAESTFAYSRFLNQNLYTSRKWKDARDKVIIRDTGCDLGIEDRDINDMIVVHHMNPITAWQIEHEAEEIFDPEFLICTTKNTHNAIHYGNEDNLLKLPKARSKNDTCPWK